MKLGLERVKSEDLRKTVIDHRTGEYREYRASKKLGGPFMRVFQDVLPGIVAEHAEMHGQSYRVLVYLMGTVDYNNELLDTAEVAGALRLPQSNVSRAYRELREARIIFKRRTGYFLSPKIAWKGNAKGHEAAYTLMFAEGLGEPGALVKRVEEQEQRVTVLEAEHIIAGVR